VVLTGVGVLAGLAVATLAPLAIFVIVDRAYGQAPVDYAGLIAGSTLQRWLVAWIVLSVWVALWFGFIMPVRAGLRFGQVLVRSALALLTGVVLAAIAALVVTTVGQAPVYSPLGELREDLRAVAGTASTLLFEALFLVPLAGMVLWAYLNRPRPIATAQPTASTEETA
jgi:hypothetical protein